jgi:hypothetical protein
VKAPGFTRGDCEMGIFDSHLILGSLFNGRTGLLRLAITIVAISPANRACIPFEDFAETLIYH